MELYVRPHNSLYNESQYLSSPLYKLNAIKSIINKLNLLRDFFIFYFFISSFQLCLNCITSRIKLYP